MHEIFTSLTASSSFPPYAGNTMGFVGYETLSSAQVDFALHCHLAQALLFSAFTFFLHPISFPLPSLICALFVSSPLFSALLYIQYISHFSYPRSINNWWTIFDLLGVVKGQTSASEDTINTGVQVQPLLMLLTSSSALRCRNVVIVIQLNPANRIKIELCVLWSFAQNCLSSFSLRRWFQKLM